VLPVEDPEHSRGELVEWGLLVTLGISHSGLPAPGELNVSRTDMELDYQSIFLELSLENIDYVIIGGLAVNLHGIPRMTYDMDIMILLEPENIMKLVNKLANWGYSPRAPVQPKDLADEKKRERWIKEKNLKAFSFFSEKHPVGEIDLLIDSPIPYKEVRDRAIVFDLGGVKVPVISIADLIELKMQSGRKQDISDVEHLKLLMES